MNDESVSHVQRVAMGVITACLEHSRKPDDDETTLRMMKDVQALTTGLTSEDVFLLVVSLGRINAMSVDVIAEQSGEDTEELIRNIALLANGPKNSE